MGMITVCLYKQQGDIVSFEVSGHSAYASKGSDIICASVSAVAQTALLGLQHVANIQPLCKVKSGYLKCTLPPIADQETQARCQVILQTLRKGIESIVSGYPKYVMLKEQEVQSNV